MNRPPLKNVAVLAVALVLSALGTYNIFLKATWTLMDDGVLWTQDPPGRLRGPGRSRRTRRPGGDPRERRRAGAGRRGSAHLRADRGSPLAAPLGRAPRLRAPPGGRAPAAGGRGQAPLPGQCQPLLLPVPRGLLQPPGGHDRDAATAAGPRRPALYAICLLFFLMYSTSYTGKLNLADWTLLWTDALSIFFLPVVFLHFCLAFPERRLSIARALARPRRLHAAAGPGRSGGGAARSCSSPVLPGIGRCCGSVTGLHRQLEAALLRALFAVSFGILLDPTAGRGA